MDLILRETHAKDLEPRTRRGVLSLLDVAGFDLRPRSWVRHNWMPGSSVGRGCKAYLQ